MDKASIVMQCRREYDSGMLYKRGRIPEWQAIEDLYFNRAKKSLKGRFNVPMPVMSGYIDTLHSKIDEPPSLKFKGGRESAFRGTQKIQAFWDQDSRREDNDFDSKDVDVKKLAIFSGRGTLKAYGESDPKFAFKTTATDHYDFYCDPMGGGNLENHRYCGEDNIYRSKSELKAGVKAGNYDADAVFKLINGLTENTIIANNDSFQDRANRFAALGLSNSMHNFSGEGLMRFIESGTIVDGERYYVLWNYESGLAIRCQPLKEVFESELWWWVSWATHRDAFNFWSKGPADDMRPIAETIKILANQELDNRQKRNFGQRAYDPDMFPNGAELEYRPNGLVAVRTGASKVQPIASGIFQFETPELTGTINLVNWLDNYAGQKTGISAAAQGSADEAKVGIYEGNMQQVADRIGLTNKSYKKFHAAVGRRFVWACKEHITTEIAVRLIGEKGVEWDSLKAKDVDPYMDISVESSASEMQMNAELKVKKANALAALNADPTLKSGVNPKWRIEQILLNGGYSDEEVRVAMDTENNGDRTVLARASEAIEEIIDGKEPKKFRGATTGFMQKIMDFALDNTDDNLPLFQKLMAYAKSHTDIVIENMSRKAIQERAKLGMMQMGAGMEEGGMGSVMQAPQRPPMAPVAPQAPMGPQMA